MGKYKVPHFDAKGEADAFFRELGVPTTFLLTSFYWDNFIYFGMGPQRGPGRRAGAHLPARRRSCPALPPRTSAACAYGVFKRGAGIHRQDGRHRRRAPRPARRWPRR